MTLRAGRAWVTAFAFAPLARTAVATDTDRQPEMQAAQVDALTRDVEALQMTVSALKDFMERIIACANDGGHDSTELGQCRTATGPDPQ